MRIEEASESLQPPNPPQTSSLMTRTASCALSDPVLWEPTLRPGALGPGLLGEVVLCAWEPFLGLAPYHPGWPAKALAGKTATSLGGSPFLAQRLPEKLPEVTGTSRGNPEFPEVTRE